jgi:hypothetical protein
MYKHVVFYLFIFAVAVALLALSTTPSVEKKYQPAPADTNNGFAVIELFTSQGCSSCPPADALLGKFAMAHDTQVLPIAFHVDYWNRLGWKDPYSSPLYSQRQRGYVDLFNLDGAYTPQAVVNGTRQLVGSDASLLAAAVVEAKSTKPRANITIVGMLQHADTVSVKYHIQGVYNNTTVHAVLVQEQVETHIKAGENKGLSLNNYHIARDLETAQATATGELHLQMAPSNANAAFKVILFVQQGDGKIIGVAQQKLL